MTSAPSETHGDELPPGSTLCGGQYIIDGYLNAGGFGVTYLAGDSLGRRVVIKECFPGAVCFRDDTRVRPRSRSNEAEFDAILALFEKEAHALAALQHPYIVGVHQFFRENGTAYMAMDFVEGQTLLEVIENEPERLTPDEVKQLLIRLLQAVRYIHEHDILHRDISPDNILVDRDNLPVLIDFGAAREGATRVSRVLSKVLTVKDGYSPQEFYLAGSDQVHSSDLYALAATFYHVVGGVAPPSSHKRMSAAARDVTDPLIPLGPMPGYDAHFLDAINQCLSIFPQERLPSAAAWQDQIDRERRIKIQLEQAQRDEELDRRVRALVAEFHRDFEAATPPARAAAPQAPAAAPAAHAPLRVQVNVAPHSAEARQPRMAPEAEPQALVEPGETGLSPVAGEDPVEHGIEAVETVEARADDLQETEAAPPAPEPEPEPAAAPPRGLFGRLLTVRRASPKSAELGQDNRWRRA